MSNQAAVVRPLLQQLLAELQRARESPLRFQIDVQAIATAVWRRFWQTLDHDERRLIPDGRSLCRALDEVVEQVVVERRSDSASECNASFRRGEVRATTCDALVSDENYVPSLAAWLDRLREGIETASDQAVAALAMCLEGYDVRDVALRTGLGVRLVLRMLAQVQEELCAPQPSR